MSDGIIFMVDVLLWHLEASKEIAFVRLSVCEISGGETIEGILK